jgi:hypothetical protein
MIMFTGDSGSEALKRFIAEMVDQHWQENKTTMLLTSLGIQVRKFFPDSHNIMTDGLRIFISSNNIAQLVIHPENPAKVGAIPIGVHIPDDVSELFIPQRPRRKSVILLPEFWNAFHLPLKGRRFVLLSPNFENGFSIEDLSIGEPDHERYYEIRQDDLALNEGQSMNELVQQKWQKITSWISRNNLNIHDFSISKFSQGTQRRQEFHPKSADIGIFSFLEQQDQARILIPMDILIKIMSISR